MSGISTPGSRARLKRAAALLPAALSRRLRRIYHELRAISGTPWDTWVCFALAAAPIPLGWALFAGDLLVNVGMGFSTYARQARFFLQSGLGLSGAVLNHAVRQRLRVVYREGILVRRLARQPDLRCNHRIVEHNSGPVEALRLAGEPMLVVFSHFVHTPWVIAFRQRCWTGWAIAYKWGAPTNLVLKITGHPVVAALTARPGEPGFMELAADIEEDPVKASRALVRHLRRRGTAAFLAIDMPSAAADAPRRPFGPYEDFPYYLGAARIARLAGCPIVPVAFGWGEHWDIHVEWGTPVAPGKGATQDVLVTNQVLDQAEVLIGRYYLHYFGPAERTRRWNTALERWEPQQP